jgi:hypothetical protein
MIIKNLPFCLLLLGMILGFSSCDPDKTTVCHGKVVDAFTQKPIAGFDVFLGTGYVGVSTQKSDDLTDSEGLFDLEITDKKSHLVWLLMQNWPPGNEQQKSYFYDAAGQQLKVGKSNEVNLEIDVKDAVLRMHIFNATVPNQKIYGYLMSSISVKNRASEYFPNYPMIIPQGDSLTITMRTAGDVESQIFLDSLYIIDKKTLDGSIICPRYDTTDVWISY